MSRSYRKPYGTWTSIKQSARQDKQLANRAFRRYVKALLLECKDWDELLTPVRHEASCNDVWGWNRDGKQRDMHIDLHEQEQRRFLHPLSAEYYTEERAIKFNRRISTK